MILALSSRVDFILHRERNAGSALISGSKAEIGMVRSDEVVKCETPSVFFYMYHIILEVILNSAFLKGERKCSFCFILKFIF